MAFEQPGFSFTLVAAADLSSSLFRGCRTDGNGKAALPNAAGDPIAGVIYNKPKSGEGVTVIKSGIVMMEASAAITLSATVMTPVKVGTDGRIAPQAGSGVIIGWALEAASGAGIIIAVLLTGAVA